MGFFEDLISDFAACMAVESSKESNDHPDPYETAGMLYVLRGNLSFSDLSEFGALLGSEDAFEDNDDIPLDQK